MQLSLVLLSSSFLVGPLTTHATLRPTVSASSTQSVPAPDHVVIILFENSGINDSYNCGVNCSYITQLANAYGLAENYSALTHPSMGNYIALTSGSLYTNSDSAPPGSVKAVNIVDSLEGAGLTWKAYMENYQGGCSGNGSPLYVDRHNPFDKYADIYNNTARCARIVNTGSDAGNSSSVFLTDLASDSAPNYMWLTPNLCHDMHDCSVSAGNNYLANLVPKILDSYIFTTQKAALFITFDEAYGTFPKDYVTSIWAGPAAKQSYKSTTFYDHYSFLSTIENFWNLPSLTPKDASATPMSEFFSKPRPGFSLSNSGSFGIVQGGLAYNTIFERVSNSSQALSTRITCLTGLPSGSSCSFALPSGSYCQSSCTNTLKISTSPSTPAGTYTIRVEANDGTASSTQFTLTVLNPSQLSGDLNGDCKVDIFDLVRVSGLVGDLVGPGVDPRADLNLDGRISIFDLSAVASKLGNTCH